MLTISANLKRIISVPLTVALIASSAALPLTSLTGSRGFCIAASASENSGAVYAELKGASLSLEGDIGINFFIKAPDGAFDSVEFSGEGLPSLTVAAAKAKLADGTYKFTYHTAPMDHGKPVTVRLKKDGEYVGICGGSGVAQSFSYSVKDYINAFDNDRSLSSDTKALVNALGTFCNLSESYFYGSDCGEPFIIDSKTAKSRLKKYALTAARGSGVLEVTDPEEYHLKGISLLLDNKTTLRLYFTQRPDSTNLGDIKTKTAADETLYYIEKSNIGADQLSEMYEGSVTFGGTRYDLKFGALSYAESVLSGTASEDTLAKLAKALYSYSFAADMYAEARDMPASSAGSIELTPAAGTEKQYTFSYKNNVYTAVYSGTDGGKNDNWHIEESYRMTDKADMLAICETLSKEHTVGGCLTGERTAMDMVNEWELHNKGYNAVTMAMNIPFLLSDEQKTRFRGYQERLKHVDLDTEDQGLTMEEFLTMRLGMDSSAARLIAGLL